MNLQELDINEQIKIEIIKLDDEHANIIHTAVCWILDGWELPMEAITVPMIAAALFNEAESEDGSVERGESDAYYPGYLRALGYEVLKIAGHESKRGPLNSLNEGELLIHVSEKPVLNKGETLILTLETGVIRHLDSSGNLLRTIQKDDKDYNEYKKYLP